MAVTDILRDLVVMDGNEWIVDRHGVGITPITNLSQPEIDRILKDNPLSHISLWSLSEVDRQKEIDKYNSKPQRFLFYPWGIFVTAYARARLFTAIKDCSTNGHNDYIYADTDSVKILNYENHREYFENYNKDISKRLEMACIYHGFDLARIRPKTVKGVEKPLGVWDDDGSYLVFKTLGAKRYMYLSDDFNEETGKFERHLHTTVAGSNKKKTAEYLTRKYGKYYAFYKFDNNMCIPAGDSGRTASFYIDNEISGNVTDYRGNVGTYHELTAVHVEQTEYNLSITDGYIKYFLGFQLEDTHV